MAKPDGSGDESEEGKSEPKFRVIDRRMFSPDGSERDAQPERESFTPAKDQNRLGGESVSGGASAGPAPGVPIGEAYEDPQAFGPDPTFSTLVLSLSTQALVLLGEVPDPVSGEIVRDLSAGRQIIDLLAMLEQKTSGNLDADESNLLQRILYDLRIRFVELSRQ